MKLLYGTVCLGGVDIMLIGYKRVSTQDQKLDRQTDLLNEYGVERIFAEPIFGDVKDDASGELKFNLGKIELTEKEEILSIDMRLPVTYPKEKAVEAITQKAAEYGFTYHEFDWLKPVYLPLDSPIIKKLMDSYVEATGDTEHRPLSSGGATYARAMDNCVAYGIILPGVEKSEHMPNENMVVDDYKTAMKIYIHTFVNFNR